MAVVNAYTDSALAANSTTLLRALNAAGSEVSVSIATLESAAGDSNTSIYSIFKALPASMVIFKIEFDHDSIANGTDWDLGLYTPGGFGATASGTVINADVFTDGDDLSTGAKDVDGMQTLAIEDRQKPLYEHAGHTNVTKLDGYDIAWTANVVGDGGTIVTRLYSVKS
jgi:hypothetical protein